MKKKIIDAAIVGHKLQDSSSTLNKKKITVYPSYLSISLTFLSTHKTETKEKTVLDHLLNANYGHPPNHHPRSPHRKPHHKSPPRLYFWKHGQVLFYFPVYHN